MNNKNNDISIISIIDPKNKLSAKQKTEIINVVYSDHVEHRQGKYVSVKIKAYDRPKQRPNTYIAYLAYSDTYHFDVLKFRIENNRMTEMEWNFDEDEYDDDDDDDKTQFVVGTAFEKVPSAVRAVNEIYKYAKANKLRAVKLIGDKATVDTYKSYLTSTSTIAICNIGHGNENGIMLADGQITYKWFNTLSDSSLKDKVLYFNSCETYNNPLWKSITTKKSRTYIGGIINLPIPDSENNTAAFWKSVLSEKVSMLKAINVVNQNLEDNAFGIAGDGGIF